MTSLPKNLFRDMLLRYNKVYHCLRCVPNIVNCNCEHFDLERFTLLPYRSTKPRFIYIEDGPTMRPDLALDLVHKKCKYKVLLGKMKTNYNVNKKKKAVRKMNAEGFITANVVNVINHMETEPDKYFDGTYNWYYTGGCLDVTEMDGYHFIFHAIGEKMQILDVLRYPTNSTDKSCQIRFKETILELLYHNQFLIVRSKSSVFLYKFDTLDVELDLLLCCRQADSPLICAKVYSDTDLICLDLDHDLRVIPISKAKNTKEREMSLKKWFSEEHDKWSQFITLENAPDLIAVATRTKLFLVNIHKMRVVGQINVLKVDLIPNCSEITGIFNSHLNKNNGDYSDLIYLATTHELLAMRLLFSDRGKGFAKVPFNVCVRWTHQLKSATLFLKSTYVESVDTEFVFISSLVDNSTRVLCVERNQCLGAEEDSDEEEEGEVDEEGRLMKRDATPSIGLHSFYPPFKPIDLATCFNSCLQMGALAETKFDMKRRLKLSTVGLGMFQDMEMDGRGSINLLVVNCMGDISHQKLIAKREEGEKEKEVDNEYLEEMRRTREIMVQKEMKNGEKLLRITSWENLKGLFHEAIGKEEERVVENGEKEKGGEEEEELDKLEMNEEEKKEKEKKRKEKVRRMKRKSKWNRPIGKLRQYKDVLSQDLLAIWDVSEEEVDSGEEEEIEGWKKYLKPAERIGIWLQQSEKVTQEIGGQGVVREDVDVVMGDSEERMEIREQNMREVDELERDSFINRSQVLETSTQQRRAVKRKSSRVVGF